MSNKLIELKNLTKNFDDQQVLRGINLDIHENEFLTLLGPSGCGKTTTLRIIAGFEEPSGGEVLFNGIEISKLPPYKREINTVFQKYALFPHLNVMDNIGFGLNLKKVDKSVIEQKVKRMLKMVGLEGFEKRDVTLLSGGQQQLARGPLEKGHYPTIPENSEVLSLTRANGICYVDYNSVFQDYALDVSEQIAVYSVVNTLIAATDVDKVEISIEGNKEVTFGQNMQLYKFYEWNDSLLAHTKAKKE